MQSPTESNGAVYWFGKQLLLTSQERKLFWLHARNLHYVHPAGMQGRTWPHADVVAELSAGKGSEIGINNPNLHKAKDCGRKTLERLRKSLRKAGLDNVEIQSRRLDGQTMIVKPQTADQPQPLPEAQSQAALPPRDRSRPLLDS